MAQVDVGRVADALPGYELGGELGRGGFGAVLAARHRLIDRNVAVKVLLESGGYDGGDELRGRFLSEARVLAGLDHPHVVRIYDYVEKDGLCLLVMEQLTGGSLRHRGRRLTGPEQGCAIGLAAAVALAAAHDRGVLHRDVKPDNLLFTADGVPKVTDFGIAKIVEATAATTTGLVGTPRYMAPEQITGSRLGPGTDLYALGIVLYELLAGRSPWPADLPVAALLHHHMSVPPAPLTEVPDPLANIIIATLAKEASWRPPSAHTFAVHLAAAATASFGPGWLAASHIPVKLPDDVLSAAGHQPGTTPHPGSPAFGQSGQSGPSGPGFGSPSPATRPDPGSWPGAGSWPGHPGAPVTPMPAGHTPPVPTRVDPDPGRGGTDSGPGRSHRAAAGPRPEHGGQPGGRPGGRGGGGLTGRRRQVVIGSIAAVCAVVVAVGLVVGLRSLGGEDADVPAYAGDSVTVDGLSAAETIALGPDGSLYVGDPGDGAGDGRVFRIAPDGALATVGGAGPKPTPPGGVPSPSPTPVIGDGGPSIAADLQNPQGIAVGPDGALYIAESDAGRIRRIGPDGVITTVAGAGPGYSDGFPGDTGDAAKAHLDDPTAIAVDDDGVIYLTEGYRVRRIEAGRITTIAGNEDESGSAGDDGPAVNATLYTPNGLALADDGTLYISDVGNQTVRKIDPQGVISLVAGTSDEYGYKGDGEAATDALLYNPQGLAIGPDEALYIADGGNGVVRKVDADGIITTVAGTDSTSASGEDGALATETELTTPTDVAFDASGALYIGSRGDATVRRVDDSQLMTTVVHAKSDTP